MDFSPFSAVFSKSEHICVQHPSAMQDRIKCFQADILSKVKKVKVLSEISSYSLEKSGMESFVDGKLCKLGVHNNSVGSNGVEMANVIEALFMNKTESTSRLHGGLMYLILRACRIPLEIHKTTTLCDRN